MREWHLSVTDAFSDNESQMALQGITCNSLNDRAIISCQGNDGELLADSTQRDDDKS